MRSPPSVVKSPETLSYPLTPSLPPFKAVAALSIPALLPCAPTPSPLSVLAFEHSSHPRSAGLDGSPCVYRKLVGF
ncbi:hypothetical protein V6N13_065889 [Hibiscus sabdariffa]|uniref:Uncharacterized protein n=1 Tax=Hibiscus sabdariffa TaxID=183260 RepID=A0ABR2BHX5_9ROSI